MTPTRVVNWVLSILFSVALFLAALLTLVEIVIAAWGRPPWLVPHQQWSQWLASHPWNSAPVEAALVVLAAVGIVLLLLALRPGAPATLALPSDTPEVRMRASRHSLEQALSAAASRTTGVTGASATAARRTVRVTVATGTRSQPDVRADVARAVQERLADLGLADRMRAQVRVQTKENR